MAVRSHVTALGVAPVKGLRLVGVDTVSLDAAGPRGDRAFHLREPGGDVALTMRNATLVQIVPAWDPARGVLALSFPGGQRIEEAVALGEPVTTAFYDGREVPGRRVGGGFSAALSEHLGRPVELVARDAGATGADDAPVTLMSLASLGAVAAELGEDGVDARRFRMTITVDGLDPWEEHGWGGREVAVGDAVLRVDAPVVRCAVTTRDPERGRRDLPILRALAALRGKRDVTFGVWCDVVRPGTVRVGDAVVVG